MNIFVLDRNPIKAAQMMCDAHVVKMIVESCQLLSTNDRILGRNSDVDILYKATHENHPCRKCLTSPWNEQWLICHLWSLLNEYFYRYGEIHKSAEPKMNKAAELYSRCWHGPKGLQAFPNRDDLLDQCTFPKCMPDEFKVGGDDLDSVVQSYRQYYKQKQLTMKRFRYTKREMPEWLKEA